MRFYDERTAPWTAPVLGVRGRVRVADYGASYVTVEIDRMRCDWCGVSWPFDAPELGCTCPRLQNGAHDR